MHQCHEFSCLCIASLESNQLPMLLRNRNHNRNLQTSKGPLKSQAQRTSLFTSAASNQRGFPKNSLWEAQVRLPEGERMRQIRGVFQRIVGGKLRSGCEKVRVGRLGVKVGERMRQIRGVFQRIVRGK